MAVTPASLSPKSLLLHNAERRGKISCNEPADACTLLSQLSVLEISPLAYMCSEFIGGPRSHIVRAVASSFDLHNLNDCRVLTGYASRPEFAFGYLPF